MSSASLDNSPTSVDHPTDTVAPVAESGAIKICPLPKKLTILSSSILQQQT